MIRWRITDRATGDVYLIENPAIGDNKGRADLKAAIRMMSRLSVRGGALYEGK